MTHTNWPSVLADVTMTIAQLYREMAEMETAEIRGRAETMAMSNAKSATAMEQEARVVVADIRVEVVKLKAQITGFQYIHETVTTFIRADVPFANDLNPIG